MLIPTDRMVLSSHKKDRIAAVALVELRTVRRMRFCAGGGYKSHRSGEV